MAVYSAEPKLNPLTVTDEPLVVGKLSRFVNDPTGASNVKLPVCVPATAPTVKCTCAMCAARSSAVPKRHAAEVCELHETVLHIALARLNVDVASRTPKLSPVVVIDRPPVAGTFSCTYEDTGASNEKLDSSVPTVAPTVSCVLGEYHSNASDKQTAAVVAVHAVVRHSFCDIAAEMLRS